MSSTHGTHGYEGSTRAPGRRARRRAAPFLAAALAGAVLAAGCEVVNPGPVDDQFISLPASQAGLVNGSWERMNRIVGNYTYYLALPAREIFPGGQTGNYGRSVSQQAGNLGGWTAAGPYNLGQQARWIGEEAIRQFEARGDVSADMMSRAYLTAGYANRINGDFFCWGVVDSGPLFEGSHYWERAEAHFTSALEVAPDNESREAAYAGRAQTRLSLEDWAGALADARQVSDGFVIEVPMDFSAGGNTANRNHIFWANGGGGASPFRAWTVNYTFYHGYYAETGDPRTPWREFENPTFRNCNASLQGYGQVHCTEQLKYRSQDDDIRLASGAEMRLIEAEAMLRMNPGSWPAAMEIINANRTRHVSDETGQPLEPWTANDLDDAWTFLMRERGIELWLEARRFADMRRWEPYIRQYGTMVEDADGVLETVPLDATTPGTLDWPDYEGLMNNPENNMFTQTLRGRTAIQNQSLPRELCYNISGTERNNNPHFDEDDTEDDEEP